MGHTSSSLWRDVTDKRLQDKYAYTSVIALKVSKDLKKLPMEEIFGTLKVHEIELNKDKGQQKGKSITFNAQKTSK
ncbi:hypothetical protein CR513_18621, partial [Mucuna pruriens]